MPTIQLVSIPTSISLYNENMSKGEGDNLIFGKMNLYVGAQGDGSLARVI